MKTTRIIAAVLLLSAMASCQKADSLLIENTPVEREVGPHTVSILASFSSATKTQINQDSEGHFKGLWEVGDVLYVKEFVTGISSDPGLYDIESASSFVATDPLAAGGETATFTATFEPYYWESTLTAEELATYTFTYKYLACSYNPYYMRGSNDDCIPLLIDPNQEVYAGGYSTSDDMLVSKFAKYNSRPLNISFNFARLGTVVKITLKGLQTGDVVKSGTWFTGDHLMAACRLEDIVSYYPETGKYIYEIPAFMEGTLDDCYHISFSCTDAARPIVADSKGEAVLYLRVLPGVCDDWFGIICTVDRGGSELQYSKFADLASASRSLTFKDGGLTLFSVDMKPAVVGLPEPIMYISPKPRTGFTAMWPADAHATGYECYYQRYGDYWDDEKGDVPYDKVALTPVAGTGEMDGMYYVEGPSGLEADKYYLYVKAIPDANSGLTDFGFAQKIMYIGITNSMTWPDVDSYGGTTSLDKSMDPIWKVTEYGEEFFPWYFDVSNLKTNWGYLYSADNSTEWTLSTKTDPSFQHDGEIHHITLKMSKSATNTTKVYAIATNGTSTLIPQPEPGSWSESEKYYDYDFTGGSYNGFRIESGGPLYVTMLRVYYYPPTGD